MQENNELLNYSQDEVEQLIANSDNREPDERERETEGRERTAETSYNQSEEIDTETLIRRLRGL